MKKLHTIILLSFIGLTSIAQPIITTKNISIIGDTLKRVFIDSLNDAASVGASGANVTWNFTNLDSINNGKSFYVAPSTTPYAATSMAKKANLSAYAIGSTYNSYSFYNSQAGYFVVVGGAGGPVDSTIYSRYDTVAYFPFTYLTTLNDSNIFRIYVSGGIVDRVYNGRHSTVDGYGTLKLPNATYNNVIRYHNEFYQRDSLFSGSTYIGSTTSYYTKEYVWASKDYRGQLFYMITSQKKNGVSQAGGSRWYLKNPYPAIATGINEINPENSVTVYPNPFSTETILQSGEILNDATLTACNLYGQQVKQIKNITGQTITFNRDNLPSGIYFIRIIQDNKTIATKKIIIQ